LGGTPGVAATLTGGVFCGIISLLDDGRSVYSDHELLRLNITG